MGYYEKIARINLTTGEIKVEKLDVELAKKFSTDKSPKFINGFLAGLVK